MLRNSHTEFLACKKCNAFLSMLKNHKRMVVNIFNVLRMVVFDMVKIQQLPSGQLVITVPKRLAEYENLKKGMELQFKKHKDGFILEKKK